jgi:putative ABC transport system ATP-binding protein
MRSSQLSRLRRDKIGFVFQSFNLLPRLNVLDNVSLSLAYKGMLQTKRYRRASLVLDQVGLSDREYFMPRQLSGGQAQRVAIARALVNEPDIIIADEPTGNLDSSSSRLVMEVLSDVHKMGNTILMVTHNPELTRYASRIVFMHDGAIVADEVSEIGEIPALAKKRMYSVPKTTVEDDLAGISALMQAIPSKENSKKVEKTKKKAKPKKYKSRARKQGKN